MCRHFKLSELWGRAMNIYHSPKRLWRACAFHARFAPGPIVRQRLFATQLAGKAGDFRDSSSSWKNFDSILEKVWESRKNELVAQGKTEKRYSNWGFAEIYGSKGETYECELNFVLYADVFFFLWKTYFKCIRKSSFFTEKI